VCFFAKTLNLPEEMAKKELSKARKFCYEAGSDSDDSAWANELDASHVSTATSPANLNGNEANLNPSQSLPILGQLLAGDQPLGLGSNGLNTGLLSLLSGTQSSSPSKVSKKRKLEGSDADDHEAKPVVPKRVKTRRVKKAKLQASTTRDFEHAIPSRPVSPTTEKPPSEVEDGSLQHLIQKGSSPRKRGNAAVKTPHPVKGIELKDGTNSKVIDNPSLHVGPQKCVNLKTGKLSKKAKPKFETCGEKPDIPLDKETPSKKLAAGFDKETSSKPYQDPKRNGTQRPQSTSPTPKSRRREAKRVRQRPAKQASMAKNEVQAKAPKSESAPDEGNRTTATRSDNQQDPHSPQDFHSPMIQSA
jgi:hypothetical protein